MNSGFLAFLLSFSLLSCSPEKRVVAGDPEPSRPPFWYFFTVDGLDSDGDGVRDDVEIWINDYTQEYNFNLALKQFARGQLKILRVIDYLNAKIAMEQNRKDSFCLLFIEDILHPEELKKVPVVEVLLLRRILNSFWRKDQYNEMGKLIPKGTWDSDYQKENERFMSCEFQIMNQEEILKLYVKKHRKNKSLIEAIYRNYPQVKDE